MAEKKTYLKYVREFTPDIDEIRGDLRAANAGIKDERRQNNEKSSRHTEGESFLMNALHTAEHIGDILEDAVGVAVGLDMDAEHFHQDHIHDPRVGSTPGPEELMRDADAPSGPSPATDFTVAEGTRPVSEGTSAPVAQRPAATASIFDSLSV